MKRTGVSAALNYPRFFTVEEAENVLPEIEPLVAEVKSLFVKIRQEIAQASTETGISPGDDRFSDQLEKRGVATLLIARVNDLVGRIHERGCVVNGPETGLVDFPALLGSEIVFLCWKHGEQEIGHWHRIPDGFAGRRPLLDLTDPDDEASGVH